MVLPEVGRAGRDKNLDGHFVCYSDESADVGDGDIEVGPDEGSAAKDVDYIAVVPGLDLEGNGGLYAANFQSADNLGGYFFAVGEAGGEGGGVGEGEYGNGVVGEHALADVAVAAGLVAFHRMEVYFDDRGPTIEVHLAGKGGGADYGVVGKGKACKLLLNGEGGLGADANMVGEAFVIAEAGRVIRRGRGGGIFGGGCVCGRGGWGRSGRLGRCGRGRLRSGRGRSATC